MTPYNRVTTTAWTHKTFDRWRWINEFVRESGLSDRYMDHLEEALSVECAQGGSPFEQPSTPMPEYGAAMRLEDWFMDQRIEPGDLDNLLRLVTFHRKSYSIIHLLALLDNRLKRDVMTALKTAPEE